MHAFSPVCQARAVEGGGNGPPPSGEVFRRRGKAMTFTWRRSSDVRVNSDRSRRSLVRGERLCRSPSDMK